MPNSLSRLIVIDTLLREVGIPIAGVSVQDITSTPVAATIDFAEEATTEQIALGQQMLAQFDWRLRRPLSRTVVVTALNQLTAAQQNQILRHMVCDYLRTHPQLAAQIDAVIGTSLPVEEIDPNP